MDKLICIDPTKPFRPVIKTVTEKPKDNPKNGTSCCIQPKILKEEDANPTRFDNKFFCFEPDKELDRSILVYFELIHGELDCMGRLKC